MQNLQSISLLITISIVITLLVVVSLILFVIVYQRKAVLKNAFIKEREQIQQIELLQSQLLSEEATKTKIANNLHDEINPNLSLLIKQLGRLRIKHPEFTDQLNLKITLLNSTIECLRTTVYDLAPKHLIKFGLVNAIQDYLTQVSLTYPVKTELHNELIGSDLILKNELHQLQCYRMLLELVNNCVKHSNCLSIFIYLRQNNAGYTIEIQHNGKSVTNEEINTWQKQSSGYGLTSIASRCLLIGARIDYQPTANFQKILINLPF